MEYEDIKTVNDLREYLENYRQTQSNSMDSVFGIFRSDVSSLAKSYRAGEAYVYDKKEFLYNKEDFLQDFIKSLTPDDLEADYNIEGISEMKEEIQEIQSSSARFFVDTVDGSGDVYEVE